MIVVGLLTGFIWVPLCGCGGQAESAGIPPTSSPTASQKTKAVEGQSSAIPQPSAVFVDEKDEGTDPFFPGRRQTEDESEAEEAPVPAATLVEQLEVKAIFGSRRARINDQWLSPGSRAELTLTDGATVSVRLLAINETSVVVEIPNLSQQETLHLKGRR